VVSKPGSSRFHLFSHFHHFSAEPQRLPGSNIFCCSCKLCFRAFQTPASPSSGKVEGIDDEEGGGAGRAAGSQVGREELPEVFFLESGVDVMITIFCDFCLFSAKKTAFFSKTNVMIIIFAKTNSSLSKKPKNFR
jgi:hypothetical protein